jgi:acyl-coenzyme A synthetase/AMP-(fatty) acid ligase
MKHRDVAMVAVVGVPDPLRGEAVKVCIDYIASHWKEINPACRTGIYSAS